MTTSLHQPSGTRCRWHFLTSSDGATSIEYAVLLGLTIAVASGGAILLGHYALTGMSSSGGGLSSGGGSSGGTGSSGGGSSGTSQGRGQPVFTDNFSDPNFSNARWKFSGSAWQLTNGTLQAGPVNGWNNLIAYAKNSDFSDGTVSTNFTLEAGSGVGLFFHLSGNPINQAINGYCFQYDPGYADGAFVLRKWVGGVELSQPLAVATPPAGYQWYGVPRSLSVTTQGSHISASVDGTVVLSLSDKSFSSGGAGLRLWNNPDATFTSFSVTVPGESND